MPTFLIAPLIVVLSLAGGSTNAATPPVPAPPALPAKGYVLLDAFSGRILVGQNDTERLEPASLTKLMTAYAVFQALKDGKLKLDQTVPISTRAWKAEGSRTFVDVGSRVRVDLLLQGMIVQSGNDATIALAEAVGGSEETFAALMNQYSQRLGLKGSHWTNSSGLPDPQHYTTARDIAILGAALVREFPEYYKWYSQRSFTYNNITQQNRNGLLDRDPTVDGIKTGHTEAAGYCLASSALRDGMRLVSVVMGSASPKAREDASAALLGYGFNFYETRRLYAAGQRLGTTPVYKVGEPVPVVIHTELYATAARGELANAKVQLVLDARLIAPLAATTPVGRLRVTLGGSVLADVPVYPAAAVQPGNIFRRLIDTVRLWFS
ncbi:MAG TPA: D-alanyl-D-alanine carboxypeptidase family protein [Steroidobacteraceae bacterium]|nr:D-alanyl-D-alanine carboxypeptidase family protein [Steroidobacteraceae bacterium]